MYETVHDRVILELKIKSRSNVVIKRYNVLMS